MSKPSKLVGIDFAETARRAGEILQADHDANFQKRLNEAEDRERRAIEGNHHYYVRTKQLPKGFVQVETNEEFPLVGERLGAIGRNYETAIVELRMAYASELFKRKLCDTFDEARRYTLRCTFVPDLTADL